MTRLIVVATEIRRTAAPVMTITPRGAQTGRSRCRLSEEDRRLAAVLLMLANELSPVVDRLLAGEVTFADRQALAATFERTAELVRGTVIDAGRDAGGAQR